MSAPNTSFTQVSAITRKFFLPKMADNIFLGNPLLKRSQSKNWARKIDGGTEVVIPLEYAINGTAGWFTGADTLSLNDNDMFTAANLSWKQLYAPITISRRDELKNMGQARVIDFVKSKVKNAEKTMRRKLTTGLYSDGTDSDSIVGLRAWVSTSSTVGGISQSSNSWYQAQVDSSTTTLTISAMQDLFNDSSEDDEQPSVGITTKSVYNKYYALLQPQQRFVDTETAKGGFSSLMFNSVPIISDTNCPSYHLFFLNESYLHLLSHKAETMRMTDFEEPINQNVKVAKIFWAGVFGTSNNRYQGLLSAITA